MAFTDIFHRQMLPWRNLTCLCSPRMSCLTSPAKYCEREPGGRAEPNQIYRRREV
jgi:hypothetical protein